MKAIKITTGNQQRLATQFGVEDLDRTDRLPIGYILVTAFGVDEHFETLTTAVYESKYGYGPELKNGFFEVLIP
jgi:hypothetical protein